MFFEKKNVFDNHNYDIIIIDKSYLYNKVFTRVNSNLPERVYT